MIFRRACSWALHFLSLRLPGNPTGIVIPTPADEPTRPFRYCPHEDQREVIDLALSLAKEAIGLEDDGTRHRMA